MSHGRPSAPHQSTPHSSSSSLRAGAYDAYPDFSASASFPPAPLGYAPQQASSSPPHPQPHQHFFEQQQSYSFAQHAQPPQQQPPPAQHSGYPQYSQASAPQHPQHYQSQQRYRESPSQQHGQHSLPAHLQPPSRVHDAYRQSFSPQPYQPQQHHAQHQAQHQAQQHDLYAQQNQQPLPFPFDEGAYSQPPQHFEPPPQLHGFAPAAHLAFSPSGPGADSGAYTPSVSHHSAISVPQQTHQQALPEERSAFLPPAFSDSDDEEKPAPPPPQPAAPAADSPSPTKGRRIKVKQIRKPAPQAEADDDAMVTLRRSSRGSGSGASGNALNDTSMVSEIDAGRSRRSTRAGASAQSAASPAEAPSEGRSLRRGRNSRAAPASSPDPLAGDTPHEDDEKDAEGEDDDEDDDDIKPARRTRSGRPVKSYAEQRYSDEPEDDAESEDEVRPRGATRTSKTLGGFVAEDEEEEDPDAEFGRKRFKRAADNKANALATLAAKKRAAENARRRTRQRSESDIAHDDEAETSEDGEGEGTSSQPTYTLRQRKQVNYSMAPPPPSPPRDGFGRPLKSRKGAGKNGSDYELEGLGDAVGGPSLAGLRGGGRKGKTGWDALPATMTGKDYARAFGDEPDSSDEDIPAARKAGNAGMLGSGGAAGGLLPPGAAGGAALGADLGANRDAVGRMKKDSDLADADPLGVNMAVDFSSVGGLDGHVQQLKEMVSLPLLYPEVFQRFKVTPPRGVLFHGPPGTGKTLVARALAASCSSSGQPISFFMRKGADCLSKWVGEAERQLRLLFEEARAAQPSIIFFDEIDGLAPVRSSKQDQIHASIVSTLLALMDGMDGRGQVVVIGATNRPDSVDPALRRPGRFDREFYFGLPNREARRAIIDIQTREWEPPLDGAFKDRLAEVTKGYGGADLRALCTEAALNAVQRRYPQIYQTTERLLLHPETIQVDAKDFMMSVNKIVPSSARSASSAAAPLPEHLKPLLSPSVDAAIVALQKVLPPAAKRNPLEEAMYEDDVPVPQNGAAASAAVADGGFGREMMLQSFEALRVFRPRLLIHGRAGMGQGMAGAALLHHLEGYHVQTLDIGTLMGDSARTPEAAIVQLFVEAKRHKPSVLYIPSLVHWANSVSDGVRSTTKALLDGLNPADPVLLLAIAEAPMSELPRDVRSWFGLLKDNKVEIRDSDFNARSAFFRELLAHVERDPSEFPDALPRRKRVLEVLPVAPPRAPREPTAAELAQQAADDMRLLEHLKHRLGLVLVDLRKRYKKFTRDPHVEYNLNKLCEDFPSRREKGRVIVTIHYTSDYVQRARRRRHSSVEPNRLTAAGGASSAAGSKLPSVEPPSQAEIQANGEPAATDDTVMAEDEALQPGQQQEQAQLQAMPPSSAPAAAEGSAAAALPIAEDAASAMAESEAAPVVPELPGLRISSLVPEGYERDLVIWTISLERMQKRLYLNGYLTVADFVEDLEKIVFNAEQAQEVDRDRLLRAHQMRNDALISLDQLVDPASRDNFVRMAARMLAREKAEAEAAAASASQSAAAAASAVAAAAARPSGERQSARVQGKAPEHALVDVVALERENKRARRSSDYPSGGEGSEGRKRLRQEADAATQPTPDGLGAALNGAASNGLLSDAAPAPADISSSNAASQQASSSMPQPVLQVNGSAPSEARPAPIAAPTGLAAPIVEMAAETPPPAAPHPAFVVPEQALAELQARMLSSTSGFSVDELEQLRAAAFDAIWRHRAAWDRTPLVKELADLVADLARAVDEERKEDRLEREELQRQLLRH